MIQKGAPKGQRSEAILSVLNSLVNAGLTDKAIIGIFESYPVGEKYREKGKSRERWLMAQIAKARVDPEVPDAPEYITKLNQTHAVILNMGAGQCTIMNEKINPITGRPDVDFSHVSDFRVRYANLEGHG